MFELRRIRPVHALLLIACLAGCGKHPTTSHAADAPVVRSTPAAAATPGTAPTAAPAAPAKLATATHDTFVLDKNGKQVPLVSFDVDKLPVSSATLGSLPFFSLPQGYEARESPKIRAWARFPVRVGNGLHWVAGRTWSASIDTTSDSGKEFSRLEFEHNLDGLISAAGGSKVFTGPLLRDAYFGPDLEDEIGGGFIDAVNHSDATATVYVIHRAQGNIWVQVVTGDGDSTAGMAVVEETPFHPTANWSDAFPYLSLPTAYAQRNQPTRRDFDRFPFWTGAHFEPVEGRTWQIDFDNRNSHAYSMEEVRRNLEAMMSSAHGELLFAGRLSQAQSDSVPESLRSAYSNGAGFDWHDYELRVYRVDLPDGRQVWVHARLGYLASGWVVAERKGFEQTAALLPASAMKQQLDTAGKVQLHVNFATDNATILPQSQPQIDQVVQLLADNPALKLAINGHTDNTGSKQHNQALSEGRAQAVVAALQAHGVDASRLHAAGFGDSQPVADNATEQGKARNRRVELIKL